MRTKLDPRLLELLAQKKTLVKDLPEWMLPSEIRKRLEGRLGALWEVAGRDSFAALIKALKEEPLEVILPTLVYTGTEYGDWRIPLEKIALLKERLEQEVEIAPPVFLGSPPFWHRLCGRYLGQWSVQGQFISPCIGCHFYVHVVRLPLARQLGFNKIIAGERERHENRIKINQISLCLDHYLQFLAHFGVQLLLPLRYINFDKDLKAFLPFSWEEGKEQMACVLSRNYVLSNHQVPVNPEAIRAYFKNWAWPEGQRFLEAYL